MTFFLAIRINCVQITNYIMYCFFEESPIFVFISFVAPYLRNALALFVSQTASMFFSSMEGLHYFSDVSFYVSAHQHHVTLPISFCGFIIILLLLYL